MMLFGVPLETTKTKMTAHGCGCTEALSDALHGQSRLSVEKEPSSTDRELREGSKILLVGARDRVFLAALHPETIFSRRVRIDLFHKRRVHQDGAVNPNESERLEFLRHHGNCLAKEIGNRLLLEQHVVALGDNGDHIAGIDKEDFTLDLDGHPDRWLHRWPPASVAFALSRSGVSEHDRPSPPTFRPTTRAPER